MQNTILTTITTNRKNISEVTSLINSDANTKYNYNQDHSLLVDEHDDEEVPTVRRTERYGKMQTGAAVTGLALVPTTVSFYFLHALSLGLKNIKQVKKQGQWVDFAEATAVLLMFLVYASLCYRLIFKNNQNNIRSLIAPRGPIKAAYANHKYEANQTQDKRLTYIYHSELKPQQITSRDEALYHLSVRKIINIDFDFYMALIRQHLSVLDLYEPAELNDEVVKQRVVGNYLIAYLLLTKVAAIAFRFDQFTVDANKDPELKENTKYLELLAQELKNLNSQPLEITNIQTLMQQKKAKFISEAPKQFEKADYVVNYYQNRDNIIKKHLLDQNQYHNPTAYRNIFKYSSEKQITHKIIAEYAREYQTGSENKLNIAPS